MRNTQSTSRLLKVLLLLVLVGGVGLGLWMSIKAHDFYYPGRLHTAIHDQESTFRAETAGRYELSYRDEVGDLRFKVTSADTSKPIPVERFDLLTEAFHTSGWRGYAFEIGSPGEYRVSVEHWPEGAEVHVSYTDTAAIMRWALGGILLSGICFGALMLTAASQFKRRGSAARSVDTPNAGSA